MSIHTTPRGTARLRIAALVAAPVLALSVACQGGDDGAQGSDEVASAPGDKGGEGGSRGKEKPAATGKSAFFDAQMKYVRCMRAKAGLKDYPDPKLSGYLDWSKIDALVDPKGKGEEYKGGKDGVCAPELRAAMNLEPERDAQKDYESMLAHAKCMRENGVSEFANPTMSGGNVLPGGEANPTDPSMDRDSPAYRKAREACADKLLEGLDGMQ
ncbi:MULTISPECIES: hypothetical protein [Streptomyces]|uniref:hypothetical protein n=1 Tax=Streptomyces TaxID=1883 RepID=UPI001E3FC8B5|nr:MULTISPECIES: hypothetical protein [Streptomyces]UFQ17201.1 hypothetical protein J2N69_20560 [Streptomyces huasconensis]WCL86803.1 hypothetical protein PPN52_20565 [Streptomyces sp. JCM 35825]